MARKVIKLNEKQLSNIVKRVISEKTRNSRRPIKEQSFNPFDVEEKKEQNSLTFDEISKLFGISPNEIKSKVKSKGAAGGAGEAAAKAAQMKIVQYPGDKTWEYTQIDGVWHTRKKGSKEFISLADAKYKSTVDKLNKAFPKGAVAGTEESKGDEQKGKEEAVEQLKTCAQKFPPKNADVYNRIYDAVKGWGTDEKALFRALDELNNWSEWVSMNKAVECATSKTRFGKKFTNMYDFIADDLSGNDLREFRTILRELKKTKGQGDTQQAG